MLKQATEEQQQDFSIESDGYGIWWEELDDGIALHHLLQQLLIKPATKRVAGRSPAIGFIFVICGRFESKLL